MKHNPLDKLSPPTTHKRKSVSRRLIKAVRQENIKQAIGQLFPGCEIYGFTKGQFCLIDIIEHCLEQTGGADVVVSTWSAASGDIKAANRLMTQSLIKSLRFIVDFSFKSRKPHFCADLLNTFGQDCIRVSKIHAKFCTIKNEQWALTIRTSMNLNYNPRFENFEISDDVGLYNFMNEIVQELWATQESHDGFNLRPSQNERAFDRMYRTGELRPVTADALITRRL
ncbi:hypothetical protein C4571_02090 [Candidatus Parcubacteria bacterium]|nr:MAG: hypothetical protein C4571_02090 [Candidatus Parcubacteria bacterium]